MTEQPPSANDPSQQPSPPGYGPPPPGYGPPPPGFGPPPPGYPQPGYGYPPQAGWVSGYAAPPRPTNVMAILALVFIFVFTPLALVFGLIARSQIKKTGEAGSGMALAGIIVGALSIVFVAVLVVVFMAAAFSVGHVGPAVVTVPA